MKSEEEEEEVTSAFDKFKDIWGKILAPLKSMAILWARILPLVYRLLSFCYLQSVYVQ